MSTCFARAWGALASTMVVAAAIGHGAPASAQTSFTYQGQLKSGGAPYNGTADLRFTLYTAASGGSIVGAPQDVINVSIADGVITTGLDFGAMAFDGAPRWLQIEVKTPSTGGSGPYTPLTPRQAVNPAPYAMYALNANTPFGFNGANGVYTGAGSIGIGTAAPTGGMLVVQTPESNYGMLHTDGARTMATWVGPGLGAWFGTKTNTNLHLGTNNLAGQFVLTTTGDLGLGTLTPNGRLHVLGGPGWTTDGWNKAMNVGNAHAMQLSTGTTTQFGMGGTNLLGGLPKLYFFHTNGQDTASPPNYYMVHTGAGDIGMGTTSPNGRLQIVGGPGWTSDFWNKAINISNGHAMEFATGTSKFGIGATSGLGNPALHFFHTTVEDTSSTPNYHMKLMGNGFVGIGDFGTFSPAHRLHVNSPTSAAFFGRCTAANGVGVAGEAVSAGSVNATGVQGICNAPGWAVFGFGNTGASGVKNFRIDHPLDPENKYLQHFCAEGVEPLNIYNGTVVADGAGQAWVQLPDYFESINRDPRYQLTAIGAPAPNLHIAQEVMNNRFMIAGAAPGMKISWEVKAVRDDRWVQANGAAVEVEKPEHLRGTYQHPELYGFGVEYAEFPRNTPAPITAHSEQSPAATTPER